MNTALTLTLYKKNEPVRELRQSILPWGILEYAIELQETFKDVKTDDGGKVDASSLRKEQLQRLADFVIYIFEDDVTREELNRQASVSDMFALYTQIFTMVGQITSANPIVAQAINRRANQSQ